MKKWIKNPHPGDILNEEFLKPLGLSAYQLYKDTGIPQSRLSEIMHGKRSISANYALKLGKYFDLPPQFWLGLQNDYDLLEAERKIHNQLSKIKKYTVKNNSAKKVKTPSVA
ncbi:HigA family addiction module antitoxin [Leptospira andrefontaineae]|uniref:Addiction module antidote protein, HigA family n=1 Tax=Leptospira andrefontaineae TaxID=2484976 RepID=A0A4R9H7E8_9LEPT|nr:HigA family addiction module antitoxin [Leptospira andrefontaineae]TGK41518.1 addiction module antidote protein, HigA family [Leptospira andrefontaineae]